MLNKLLEINDAERANHTEGQETEPKPEYSPDEYLIDESESTQENQQPAIAKFELSQKHKASGILNGEAVVFDYYEGGINALDFIDQVFSPEHQEGLKNKLDSLGLENINGSIYTREGEALPEKVKNGNIYVLLHGWTGNKAIYSDVTQDDGFSVVQEILAKDGNAIVITLDGNGFGGTNFRKDVIENDLARHCTPEAYARQVDFFVKDVMGVRPEEVGGIMGHSMGGAAALVLSARHGYENCVGLAPAFFPTAQNMELAEQLLGNEETGERIEALLRKLGYRSAGEARYAFVAGFAKFGVHSKKVIPKTTRAATDVFFNLIGSGYMGVEVTGDTEVDQSIVGKLLKIHKGELDNHALVSYALANLRVGIDISNWDLHEIIRLHRCAVVTADNDKLVSPTDIANTSKALAVLEFAKASSLDTSDMVEEDLDTLRASVRYFSNGVGKRDTLHTSRFLLKGGHYAPVFNHLGVDLLLEKRKIMVGRTGLEPAQT